MRKNSPEKQFVKDFIYLCEIKRKGCFVIPDPNNITAKNRGFNRELKRPFDLVLVTPNNTYCIEAKYGYNKQMEHQKQTEQKMRRVNKKAYYVIKKTKPTKTKRTSYLVIQNEEVIHKFDSIDKLIDFFE